MFTFPSDIKFYLIINFINGTRKFAPENCFAEKVSTKFMTKFLKNESIEKGFLSSHATKSFFISTFQLVKQEVSAQ
jgi:hypothetical protein